MTQVRKKVAKGRLGTISRLDFKDDEHHAKAYTENRKSKSRRTGILLIIFGCLLIVLSAADMLIVNHEEEQDRAHRTSVRHPAIVFVAPETYLTLVSPVGVMVVHATNSVL